MTVDNLSRYTVEPSGCWLWTGPKSIHGYGHMSRELYGTRLAHRAFYLASGREISDGLDLDHLCRIRHCVNPEHLEPVTRAINLQRGHDARETCKRGHDLTDPANLKPGTHECIQCWRIRYQAAGARYRARRKPVTILIPDDDVQWLAEQSRRTGETRQKIIVRSIQELRGRSNI